MTLMLEADLMLLSGESLFLRERYYRTAIAAQITETSASTKHVVDKEKEKGKGKFTTDPLHCRFYIAYFLNAKLIDGTKISPCKRGRLPFNTFITEFDKGVDSTIAGGKIQSNTERVSLTAYRGKVQQVQKIRFVWF